MTHEFAKAHKRSASNICNNNLIRTCLTLATILYLFYSITRERPFLFLSVKIGHMPIYILTYTEVKKLGSDYINIHGLYSSFAFKKINLTYVISE